LLGYTTTTATTTTTTTTCTGCQASLRHFPSLLLRLSRPFSLLPWVSYFHYGTYHTYSLNLDWTRWNITHRDWAIWNYLNLTSFDCKPILHESN
jgi:hypothetical protein